MRFTNFLSLDWFCFSYLQSTKKPIKKIRVRSSRPKNSPSLCLVFFSVVALLNLQLLRCVELLILASSSRRVSSSDHSLPRRRRTVVHHHVPPIRVHIHHHVLIEAKVSRSFDEMVEIDYGGDDFHDPTTNVRRRCAFAIAKPTPRGY